MMQAAKDSIDLGIICGDIHASLHFYHDLLGLTNVGVTEATTGTMHRLRFGTRCPFRKSYASTFWRRQRIELGHCRIMFDHFSLVIRSSTMPVPLAPPVTLGCDEQSHLASIVRAHSTPQALVFRCRLILRTAAPDRPSNLQVAQELHCNRHTVGRWRSRYLAQGLSGLQDAPRPGRPRRFSPLSASGCDGDGHP